jgi:hypothetical protein
VNGANYKPLILQHSQRTLYSFTYEKTLFFRKCYRVPEEERSIFWEVIVSVILSKNCICTCVLFRTVSEIVISLHSSKIVDKKRYHVLFLIPVFIVQVTKLVQFTYILYIF